MDDNALYVLITGANSGVGLGFCLRLVDEFLQTRPQSESLVLIFTTRDQRKGDATVAALEKRLQQTCHKADLKVPGIAQVLRKRIVLRQERLDLLSLVSVQRLCRKLRETTPRLDSVVFNAGIGGWTGPNWPSAIFSVLTKVKTATTWPTYKMARTGWLADPQLSDSGSLKAQQEGKLVEPPLGQVFCGNFFGHYLMGHYLAPLLTPREGRGDRRPGRIIWVSSIEAHGHALDLDDVQGLASTAPYEASKRLTDLIAITSRLPSTTPYTDTYLASSNPTTNASSALATQHPPSDQKPRFYLTHPGICGTAILPLPRILEFSMLCFFYIARLTGSPWHTILPETAALSMVWLVLARQSTLDAMEAKEGVGKWGSATNVWGEGRVERTEVDGWGWGGRLGEYVRKGRSPFARALTVEGRERFEGEGRRAWEVVEGLRGEWEGRLREAGLAVEME